MPPSRFSCRCLVFLLLVAGGAGLLARPAEAAKRPFDDIVNSAARRHGVNPGLVHAVIAVESGYRANAQSPAGAQGLMQLMPGTQRQLGVSDAFDPQQNVDAGVAYLRRLTDEFGTVLALAAYNAGPGAVRRYNGIPPYKETRAYVQAVLDRGRSAADAQALAEHDSSGDRAHAAAEADVAEGDPGDRRLQDDHLAVDGAAGRAPHALDRDNRAWVAVPPDPLVNPRGAQAGALRQDVADERPIHRSTALDRTHLAADTARLVLHHGADRLTADAGMRREGPGLPVLAAMQASGPGARRGTARRPSSFKERPVPTSGSDHCAPLDSSLTAADRGVDPLLPGHATCAPAGSPRGRPEARSPAAASPRFKMHIRTPATDADEITGAQDPSTTWPTWLPGRPRDPAASNWLPARCDPAPERHSALI